MGRSGAPSCVVDQLNLIVSVIRILGLSSLRARLNAADLSCL